MPMVRLLLPILLSLACFIVAIYFSVTDHAYRIRGCRLEDYPEIGFLIIAGPLAIAALFAAIKSRGLWGRAYKGSLFLSGLSAMLMITTLVEPGGGACSDKPGMAIPYS